MNLAPAILINHPRYQLSSKTCYWLLQSQLSLIPAGQKGWLSPSHHSPMGWWALLVCAVKDTGPGSANGDVLVPIGLSFTDTPNSWMQVQVEGTGQSQLWWGLAGIRAELCWWMFAWACSCLNPRDYSQQPQHKSYCSRENFNVKSMSNNQAGT